MPYFHIYVHYKQNYEDKIDYPNEVNFTRETVESIVKRYENGNEFLLGGFVIRSDPSHIKKIGIFETSKKVAVPPDWNEIGRTAELVTRNFTILPAGAHSPIAIFAKLKLHPIISNVSGKLFKDGFYAQAILEAYKALNKHVQKRSKREDLDGKDLMSKVFRISYDRQAGRLQGKPILQLNKLRNQSERNEQEGFMFLFMGSMTGVRNPKAHDIIVQRDPFRTLKYLCLASLLMERVGEATINVPTG
jgi:uncharacterized protein (TIGR02391 family)